MKPISEDNFEQYYQSHLKLKGLQPKTIEAYARAIRRIGAYFEYQITTLSEQQLLDYFSGCIFAMRRATKIASCLCPSKP